MSHLFETMILCKSMLIFRFCVAPNFPGRVSKADALRIRWTGRRVATGHLPAGPDVAGGCHVEADEVFKEPIWVKKGVCSLCHEKKVHHSVSLNMYIGVNLILKIYIYMSYTVTTLEYICENWMSPWSMEFLMFPKIGWHIEVAKVKILCIRWSQLIKTRK